MQYVKHNMTNVISKDYIFLKMFLRKEQQQNNSPKRSVRLSHYVYTFFFLKNRCFIKRVLRRFEMLGSEIFLLISWFVTGIQPATEMSEVASEFIHGLLPNAIRDSNSLIK